MRSLYEDLRGAVRLLGRSPAFALFAVFALSLGIGANTAVFSLTNAFFLRPLPFPGPERLVLINQTHVRKTLSGMVSYPDFLDWQRQSRTLESVGAIQDWQFNLVDRDAPELVQGARISASFFGMLGAKPLIGRDFVPADDSPSATKTVLMGQGLWQRRFGGRPDIVGQAIKIDGVSHTVIGVLPAGQQFPPRFDLWVPLALDASRANRGARFLNVIGRLKSGVPVAAARAELETMARQTALAYPANNAGIGARAELLHERLLREVGPAAMALSGTVAFVLLIACANIANLLLARAAARRKEIAVRIALGAGRWRIIRQLLTESLLVSLLGGAGGLLVAHWGLALLAAVTPAGLLPMYGVHIDGTVLAFTLVLALLTGVIFGLAPALEAARTDLNGTLKQGGRTSGVGRRKRLRAALVVAEVTLAVVLLSGAGLLLKSFAAIQAIDPGFQADRVLTASIGLPPARYATPERRNAFFAQVLARVSALPGVIAAGGINRLPATAGSANTSFEIEGRPPAAPEEWLSASRRVVTPGYFASMGIPLRRGRMLDDTDGLSAPAVVLINESMARRYWPQEDPIGRRVRVGGPDPRWATVAGIVGDVRQLGLIKEPVPELYFPQWQQSANALSLTVRTAGDPLALAKAIRAEVDAVDPELPAASIRSMRGVLDESVAQPRIMMFLLAIFAGIALALAAMGLYGLISYSVAQRIPELGVRMALGARRGDILRLVVGEGCTLTLIGVAIGVLAALGLTRVLASFLYGVSARDPLVLGAVALALAPVALAASLFPALRASRVHPMVALRND